MKNTNADIFQRNKKRNTRYLIIGICLLLVTGVIIYLGIENERKKLPDPININDIEQEEDKYTYIDINTEPYLFGVYEVDGVEEQNKFYLAMDKDNRLYILYMNENKTKDFNITNIKENPLRITGLTKLIPNDIKKLAISSYNEVMEEEYLTDDNFKDYVGYLYLDMEEKLNDSTLYYIGASLTGFFSFLIIILYLVIIIKNKKTIKNISSEELSKIDAELSQMMNSEYKKMNFFMLKDYIVDLTNNIVIIKYEDIIWAYPFEQRYNGLLVNKYLKIRTLKNKKYAVASTRPLEKNKDKILQDILVKLQEKNENIIIGYNLENKEKVKEIIKEEKNK